MLKKLIAAFAIIVVLTAIAVWVMLPASAAQTTYAVGYARVDINPYKTDGVFSSGIMALPLRGSGDVWNRLSENMVDDNGDGVIDENDGLKVTCIAVTDSDGTTALFITVDLIGGTLYSKISTEIVDRVDAAVAAGELENVVLTKNEIFYAGTHTHNAPDTSVYTSAGKTGTNDDGVSLSEVNENLGIWIDRTIEDVGDAAILALKDRATATVTKDQISVPEVTSEAVVGKVLNSSRHYTSVDKDGETVVSGDNFNGFSTTAYQTGRGDDPQQVTDVDETMYLLNFTFADSSKLPIIFAGWRGHPSLNNSDSYENGGRKCLSSDFVSTFRHALEYGCEVTTNKTDPTGYVETWTLGTEQKYRVAYFQGTGGNVNPRGYELLKDENGEVLTYGEDNTPVRAHSWIDESGKNATYNGELKGRACSYGVVLAQFAQEGVEDGKNEETVTAGEIRTMQTSFVAARKIDGVTQTSYDASVAYQAAVPLQAAAAATYTTANSAYKAYVKAYDANVTAQATYAEKQAEYDAANFFEKWFLEDALNEAKTAAESAQSACNTAKTTYDEAMVAHNAALAEYETFMTANSTNDPITEATATVDYAVPPDSAVLRLPFVYKDPESGETFAIASKYHANAVIADWNANLNIPKTATTTVKLSAILMGSDLAFVVVPGEPFDYYYQETGVYTDENNLWHILENDSTYGKPIVIGYANGAQGYFPNSEAYSYNEGSEKYAVGSYEVHTSNYAQGTGEEMIYYFDQMLTMMEAESYTGTCQHCDAEVTWQPYQGTTPLTDGHYYLSGDYKGPQTQIAASAQVCFDLNGYTLTGDNRAFYINKNAVFSLMDSSKEQTGIAQGSGGTVAAGYGGGTINAQTGSTFNFYSGNLKRCENGTNGAVTGGTVLTYGTFNMYGGTIHGGKASSFTGEYLSSGAPTSKTRTAIGGTVYVSKGVMNVYGGQIYAGSMVQVTGTVIGSEELGYAYSQTEEPITGLSPCVAVNSTASIKLSGDAEVESIYFYAGTAADLTVEGAYTGTAELSYPEGTTLELLTDIGDAVADDAGIGADVSGATITFKDAADVTAAVRGSDLVVSETAETYYYCEGCKDYFLWTPMTDADFDVSTYTKYLPVGHYVLTEDVSTTQKQLNYGGSNPGTFCIDLAGYTFTGATRAFYAYSGATLNIMDSGTGGTVVGKGLAGGGGTLYLTSGATINLHSGTVVAASTTTPKTGGAVSLYGGTFNVYGGTVQGGSVSSDGGTIYVTSSGGVLNFAGGQVLSGTGNLADCVYVSGTGSVTVSGDAQVEDVYFAVSSADKFTVDTSGAAFTGFVQLSYETQPANGDDIGNYTAGNEIRAGALTIADSDLKVASDGTDLKAVTDTVDIYEKGELASQYTTLDAAINAYTYDGTTRRYIKLNVNTEESITVSNDIYLDLNGCNIVGDITVQDGATLYCMDSMTDDYTVADSQYGKLTGEVTGAVTGVPIDTVSAVESEEEPYRAGYLKVSRDEGISFHRVNLRITTMSLRPGCVGVYYQSKFIGDEVVAKETLRFGVALSVAAAPTAENMDTQCAYSVFKTFQSGSTGNTGTSTGTLLEKIMKPENTDATNAEHAQMDIYGRAYIQTKEGYLFGNAVVRNLKQLVEGIDGMWNRLNGTQQGLLLDMYGTYANVMKEWELSAITAAYTAKTGQ